MSVTDSDYKVLHVWGLEDSISPRLLTLQTYTRFTLVSVKSMLPIPSQVSSSASCSWPVP